MTDFVDRKGTRGQQGTSLFSSRLFRRVNCGFQVEGDPNWHRIGQKTQKFPIFKNFMRLLSKYRETSRIGMLRTVIKVSICCAVVFNEKIVAVFMLKKFSNWH